MSTLPHSASAFEGELTPSIRDRVKRLILEDDALNQQVVSNQSGVGKTVLSLWLNDNYSGDNQGVEAKLRDWLQKRDEGARAAAANPVPEDPPFYNTPTATQVIWPILQYAQMRGSLALIYGGAGVCKSSTTAEYKRRMPNVWSVQATPATSRLSPFLNLVANELSLTLISSKPAIVEQAIVEKLTGTKGLLIIDDAQFLTIETLYQAAWLRERASFGIVFMGNEFIHGSMQKGFAQLYSRVGKRRKLSRPTRGDLVACLDAWESHQGLPPGTLRRDIEDFFWGKGEGKLGPVRQDGGLRNVSETLALAVFLAQGAGQSVELKHVRAAWADVSGTQKEAA